MTKPSHRSRRPVDFGIRPEELARVVAPAITLGSGRGLVEDLFRHDATNVIFRQANAWYSKARRGGMGDLERARMFVDAGILFGMGLRRTEEEREKKPNADARRKEISSLHGAIRHYNLVMNKTQGGEHAVAKRECADTRMRLAKALSDSDLPNAIRNAAFAVRSFEAVENFYHREGSELTAGEVAEERVGASDLLRALRTRAR